MTKKESVLQQVRDLCTLTRLLLKGKSIKPSISITTDRLFEGHHLETLVAEINLSNGLTNGYLAGFQLFAISNLVQNDRQFIIPKSIESYEYFFEILELLISLIKKMPNQENIVVSAIIRLGIDSIPNERTTYSLSGTKLMLIRALRKIQKELQNQE